MNPQSPTITKFRVRKYSISKPSEDERSPGDLSHTGENKGQVHHHGTQPNSEPGPGPGPQPRLPQKPLIGYQQLYPQQKPLQPELQQKQEQQQQQPPFPQQKQQQRSVESTTPPVSQKRQLTETGLPPKVTSCIRCRKLKKKCRRNENRSKVEGTAVLILQSDQGSQNDGNNLDNVHAKGLPECTNCERAGELCQYITRKQRVVKKPRTSSLESRTLLELKESEQRENLQNTPNDPGVLLNQYGINGPNGSNGSNGQSSQNGQTEQNSLNGTPLSTNTNTTLPEMLNAKDTRSSVSSNRQSLPESYNGDPGRQSLSNGGGLLDHRALSYDYSVNSANGYAPSFRNYEQNQNQKQEQNQSQNLNQHQHHNQERQFTPTMPYPEYSSSIPPYQNRRFPQTSLHAPPTQNSNGEVQKPADQDANQLVLTTSTDSTIAPTLPNLNAIDALAPNFDAYPKQISKVLYGAVGIKTNSNVSIIPPITDQVLLTRIMNAFFMHTYRICPVINKSKFMTRFNRLFKNGDGIAALEEFDDQYELYMVLAIGGTHLERSRIIGRDKRISEYFVSMALTSVHNNISKNDIKSMKNLMLLALYSFFNPAEFIAWEISGKLARMAIHLGLNQAISDSEASALSARQIEMRTRLLWSVYTIDRLTSVTLGRPVALQDDDINVPLPLILDDDEIDDITTYRLVIHLRQIEGQILKRVHSVNVHKKKANRNRLEAEVCEQVLTELRDEVEEWHNKATELETLTTKPKQSLAFRALIPWFTARYNHLLILLYRPSYLNPQPLQDILDTLGKACLETLSATYKLFKAKSLPLNWTTLYRFLMVGTTILYCLCKWAIDLMESKTEICYCIEIFQAFGSDWVVAKKCAEVFKTIENKLLEITLTDGHTSDMDNLSKELLGASSSYHEILNVHSVDLCIDSQYMYGFES